MSLMNKFIKGFFMCAAIVSAGLILLYQRTTERTIKMEVPAARRLPQQQYKGTSEIQRMNAELAALKQEEKRLLKKKEEADLRQELNEKRKQVAKLRKTVDSMKTNLTQASDTPKENIKETVDSMKSNLSQIIDFTKESSKDNQMANRFLIRKKHLEEVCSSLPNNTFHKCEENAVKGNLFNTSHDIFYCSVEKSGSTFWRRILQIIQKNGDRHDPLEDIGLGAAYGLKNLKGVDIEWIRNTMNQKGKRNVIFVRDPYTRLFSGWMDKFYATNPYWWGYGKKIIAAERKNPSNKSLECGHDVQFSEFVQAIAKDVKKSDCGVDGHFSPSFKHCLPCGLPYNFIGKYETLKEDTMYFLEMANLTHLVKFSDFETSSDMDAINDSSRWAFSNRKNVEKCMTFQEGLRRVWKRLQNRGIINFKAIFPEKALSSENITEPILRTHLLNAYRAFSPEENKLNRDIALKEAFSTVSKQTLEDLQEAFDLDFKIFDFDRFPSFIPQTF